MRKNRNLVVIPARGGSKGVPNKNIIDINGKPLIEWTILQAQKSNNVDYIHVSTDSVEIADIAIKSGANCDFFRPPDLSGDEVGVVPTIIHSIEKLRENGLLFDIVLELQPTYCLRGSEVISDCISILENKDIQSVVTCKRVETTEHPDYVMEISDNGMARFSINNPGEFRRQELRSVYACHGLVLAAKVDSFLKNKSFFAKNCKLKIINDDNRFLDINTHEDLEHMRIFVEKHPDYLL
jgi:CMP-N,N'-diacetyllegionaminic acid synthase